MASVATVTTMSTVSRRSVVMNRVLVVVVDILVSVDLARAGHRDSLHQLALKDSPHHIPPGGIDQSREPASPTPQSIAVMDTLWQNMPYGVNIVTWR